MEITLEQLQNVDPKNFKVPYAKSMLKSAIKHVEDNGGKAWMHPHILADLGIKV